MKRTAYMSYLMQITYPQVAIVAVQQGTIDGAWEQAIAEQLLIDLREGQNPQALKLLAATGHKKYTQKTLLKAAKLVTESKIETI